MKKLHPVAQQLLSEVYAFCAAHDMDRTTFGIEAVNDGHFIKRVEGGRIPQIPTMDKVRAYMAKRKARK